MFQRFEIPTPFQIGAVNAYLADTTLVDPGPDSEEAWAALLEELETHGLIPDDITQVLVTHPHPDHFGLAHRFADRGADVIASPECAAIVADFRGRLAYEQRFFVDFFDRHGMEHKTAETVVELPEAYVQYAPDVTVDRELSEGDTITVDGVDMDVMTAVGHSIGELLFAYDDAGERRAIVGDHVLADITPNPLLQPPPTEDDERPRVLPAFNESLERVKGANFDRLLAGHREVITDPAGRIDEILAAHEERTANVRDLVSGPTTAREVMEGLFGDLPVTEFFSGMSEAVGHLDVLEARGAVTRHENGGVVVYEPAD